MTPPPPKKSTVCLLGACLPPALPSPPTVFAQDCLARFPDVAAAPSLHCHL